MAFGSDDPDGLLDFSRNLRKHAKLFNMPLLVLSESENAASHDQAYEAGASDVLDLNHGPARLLPPLGHLVRQQRYCQATQEVYREGCQNAATDALTGLFNHGYLHMYLQKQVAECRSREKDLAIGVFDITKLTGLNGE